MNRQDDLNRVGLIGFTADIETYPSPDYLRNLIARYEKRNEGEIGLLGKLDYKVNLKGDAAAPSLLSTTDSAELLRVRAFEPEDNLFPNLSFGVEPHDKTAMAPASQYAQSSTLLGLGATVLTLIGLSLTWRATRREMKVAQVKSHFLASISHELKTPLTAIRAFGDLLHSGRARDSGRVREYGGMIKSESDRLTALINNILEMARLERGIRRYRLEKGFLCEAVATTVEMFRHTVEAHAWTIEVGLPSPPLTSRFDEYAIRQALLNLLSNAVKYSGESRRIEVVVKREESEAVVEVRDAGIGIAKSEQHNIFMPFHRASQLEARAKGGTGLGLAVVQEVARAHGGRVSVTSEPGAGATFRLHLPLLLTEQFDQEVSATQRAWQIS